MPNWEDEGRVGARAFQWQWDQTKINPRIVPEEVEEASGVDAGQNEGNPGIERQENDIKDNFIIESQLTTGKINREFAQGAGRQIILDNSDQQQENYV